MKHIYKSILAFSVSLLALGIGAQTQDSVLSRQVMLERDYNPTLNEATKINTEPNIYTPKIQVGSNTNFLDKAPKLTLGATRLGEVASGDIMTNVPFSKQRFYLNAGGGSHGQIEGTIGVRAVDTKSDKLDIFAGHSSANGKVKNIHSKWLYDETKAKFSDTKVNAKFQHKFEPSILNVGASYQNMGYNYYGSPLISESDLPSFGSDITLEDLRNGSYHKTKQKADIISFNAGLKSSDANEGVLKYEANIGYSNFNTKYIVKGLKGNIVDANVNLFTELGSGNIGVAGSFLSQSFSKVDGSDLFNVTVNPYYKLEELTWDLAIGANLSYVDADKSKFVIAPNIKAQFHINEVNTLYASVTGGVNNNTFLDILQENRYAAALGIVQYSRTPFDFQVGFKSGVVPNLEFELFAGYKQVKNDHVYGSNSGFSKIEDDVLGLWNMSTPAYADISTGHIGGQVKTKLIPKTTLMARAIAYLYDVKKKEGAPDKAWGRPSFTAEVSADIQPIDKLTFSISYLLMAGRKAGYLTDPLAIEYMSKNMKAISELNIRAEYEIIKQLSVFARVNNLLDQSYEQQLGYTNLGLNVLGGISVKF